jgi:DNA-binding response OmpR family regulator
MAKKICIIEDDESIQDVLNIILKRAGYETIAFSDGRAILDGNYSLPDLFLVDKQLPVADGTVICRHLKKGRTTAFIPVIMMSAFPNGREYSVIAGANDFIEKPFKIDTLLATIKKHLNLSTPELVTLDASHLPSS